MFRISSMMPRALCARATQRGHHGPLALVATLALLAAMAPSGAAVARGTEGTGAAPATASTANAAQTAGAASKTGAGLQGPAPAPHGRWDEPVGPTVADQASADYRFEKHRLDSADGKRHYRIEIAIPRQAAPADGYTALYMLDGNAAMATLTAADLQAMGKARPPVLVAIGYDIATRNDVVSRAYDYTPPVRDAQGHKIAAPVERGRAGGGADVFLDFIEAQVRPLARSRAHIDPGREMLWGHSYGGLFTLHVLYTRPRAFSAYIAGDPSAWWHDGALIEEWRAFDPARASGLRIAILAGTKPRTDGRADPGAAATGRNEPTRAALPSTPPDAPARTGSTSTAPPADRPDPRAVVADMARTLRLASAEATYEAFPQFGHGDMIRASLARALQIASGAASIQP